MKYDLCIIGGGLIGLSSAFSILKDNPKISLIILEKEADIGLHQSTHNSGVLHCGLYYRPGSQKAKLAISGLQMMRRYCEAKGIAHEICGKIVCARSADEIPQLHDLFDRGRQNGLTGLQLLSEDEAREIEPHIACAKALRVPNEGIVDYRAVCSSLKSDISLAGGTISTGRMVSKLSRRGSSWIITTSDEEIEAAHIINCAGLHSDRVARLAGHRLDIRIIPFRGDYYSIKKERAHIVKNLIYPVPDPKFPFLGVHFTRLIHGGIECGPNAVLATSREGYSIATINSRDLLDELSFPGLTRFFLRHARMCVKELGMSISKELFCRELAKMLPELKPDDLERNPDSTSGVRAQAMRKDGTLVQDFEIISGDGEIHVLNAPSPAATASLAIGKYIACLGFRN